MLASSNMLFIYCILCSVFDVVWFMRRDLYVMALYKCPVYVCMYVCMYSLTAKLLNNFNFKMKYLITGRTTQSNQ